ncbi:MAG: MFS transporter [Oscillospiraceae bacterium]|nr:MFS transporter [Oscillospiraceae bacterium]
MGLRQKFEERFPPELREELKKSIRHPVSWVKGVEIKDGNRIAPYELLVFSVANFLSSLSGAYAGKQDFLFREVYRVPPNLMSVGGIATSLYDAFNDPFVGTWMDRWRLPAQKLKWIMRIAAVTGHTLDLIRMVDGGLGPWGHILLLIFCNCLKDTINTFDSVAIYKLRSSISPYTQERVRVSIWESVGGQMAYPLTTIPLILMGWKDTFGFSDYQIIFIGALIFLPVNIIASAMKSFIKVRVDFNAKLRAEEAARQKDSQEDLSEDFISEDFTEENAGAPEKLSVRETLGVVKYNKYFKVNMICGLLAVLTPTAGDSLVQWRYLAPKATVFGQTMSGEGWLLLKDTLSGVLNTILNPFGRQIVNLFGGPLKMQKIKSAVDVVGHLIKFAAGIRTVPGIFINILVDNVLMVIGGADGVAGNMLNYEFYDYVELQTGIRSEGITTSVQGLINKTVTNNIGTVTGNAALDWMGYRGGYLEEGSKPPERYMKYVWPLATLAPVIDNLIYLIGRSTIKWTPEDREYTESALKERRDMLLAEVQDS